MRTMQKERKIIKVFRTLACLLALVLVMGSLSSAASFGARAAEEAEEVPEEILTEETVPEEVLPEEQATEETVTPEEMPAVETVTPEEVTEEVTGEETVTEEALNEGSGLTEIGTTETQNVKASELQANADITLSGNAAITVDADVTVRSIRGENYSLTIQQDAQNPDAVLHVMNDNDEYGLAVAVKSLDINANLECDGGNAVNSFGIYCSGGDLLISGGNVSAKGYLVGIGVYDGNITVSGDAAVVAEANTDAIRMNKGNSHTFEVKGSATLTVTEAGQYGIQSDHPVKVAGSARIVASRGSNGISVGSLTVNDSAYIIANAIACTGKLDSDVSSSPAEALVIADGIYFYSGANADAYRGILLNGDTGTVHGTEATLLYDLILQDGRTLTVGEGQTLTVAENVTLTVSPGAELLVKNGGTLTNNGTIRGEIKTEEGAVVSGTDPVAADRITLTPASVDFGTMTLGDTPPAARTVTIKNEGEAEVNLSSVYLSGKDTHAFSLTDNNEYPLTLSAGGSISVQVLVEPAGIHWGGNLTAELVAETGQGIRAKAEVKLVVNNPVLSGEIAASSLKSGLRYELSGDTEIVLTEGDNITLSSIDANSHSLTISGSDSGTITFESAYGLQNLTVKGGHAVFSYDCWVDGDVSVTGGYLEVSGDGMEAENIRVSGGELLVSAEEEGKAEGVLTAQSEVRITGGRVLVTGGQNTSIYSPRYGIYGETISISGRDTLVDAKGEYCAIYAYGSLTVDGELTIALPEGGTVDSSRNSIVDGSSGNPAAEVLIGRRELTADRTEISFGNVPYDNAVAVPPQTIVFTNTGNLVYPLEESNITLTAGMEVFSIATDKDLSGAPLFQGDTLTVTVSLKERTEAVAGRQTGVLKAGNESVSLSADFFTAESDDINIFTEETLTYTGQKLQPEVQVYCGSTLLEEKKDYTVSYKNNVNAYTLTEKKAAFNAKKAPTVTIKGKTRFTGTITRYFRILPADIDEERGAGRLTVNDVTIAGKADKNGVYKAQKPVPAVTRQNGKTVKLKNKKDFTVSYGDASYWPWEEYEDYISGTMWTVAGSEAGLSEPGIYRVRLKGTGNYTGSTLFTVQITKPAEQFLVSSLKIPAIPVQKYDEGKAFVYLPESGTLPGGETALKTAKGARFDWNITNPKKKVVNAKGKKVAYTLVPGEDYILTYAKNREIGTASVTITGNPEKGYVGSITKTFKITGTPLSRVDVPKDFSKAGTHENFWDTKKKAFLYAEGWAFAVAGSETGKEDNGIELVYNNGTKSDTTDDWKLKKGTHYTVSYEKHDRAGTATVIFTGKGPFSGTVRRKFKIAAYDMKEDPRKVINLWIDDPENSGTHVAWDEEAHPVFTYVKGGVKPEPVVKSGDTVLRPGVDYTLSWSNCDKVKETPDGRKDPTVTIKGKGNYSGSISRTYAIKAANLYMSAEESTGTSYGVWIKVKPNGKPGQHTKIPVTITDKNSGKVLKAGVDYKKLDGYEAINANVIREGKEVYLPDGAKVEKDDIIVKGMVCFYLEGIGNYGADGVDSYGDPVGPRLPVYLVFSAP